MYQIQSDGKRPENASAQKNEVNFVCKKLRFRPLLNFRLKFFNFVNGSEKPLTRRKNAPETPKANSGGKGLKKAFDLQKR